MRKLLQLCVDNNVEVYGYEALEILSTDSSTWIDSLSVDITEKRVVGYWDGERHEVQL